MDNLESKLQQLHKKMKENPEHIEEMDANFSFDIKDTDQQWSVKFNSNEVELQDGLLDGATCTLKMDASHFEKLLDGQLNATTAFMMGKIKAEGDLTKAMKLQKVLSNYQG
ncbi:SCP2 sterol-binding domain-containing protein [Aquisalibacillus elongatus]|uniref:Putative sterol carrier protein n=1 Tax=Aquisalibacillus elongatus TaxID=485577 RepID=A0A3N5BDS3_9BACI|nr:SCP2 sterol-binding domain-containing protein [Aquisalibacillus elongatus]RPF55836.1 putative sterol carrier protein [Aquisalibacillus elongatus]